MMIFFAQRLAYLAVPKTGTSALERALGGKASATFRDPPGIKHTNARSFEKKFRRLFERKDLAPLETMAIVREPEEWLGSWYRYRQRSALSGHPNSTENVTFDQFVSAYLNHNQPPYAQVGRQSRFVTDAGGDLLVNHLFAYSDFTSAVQFMERRLNCSIALKSVNQSQHLKLVLSSSLRDQLISECKLDYEIYQALQDGPLSIS
ncbi:MAG: sulfotransferase family 2 domain-containing protein [Litoreibacter sp.]|uniref:sulfotransferase family 2 domain-containing protein n=1 Tax=Litoreibacter sp. TaxID=1969459 RepID=UPI0032987194